MNTRLIRSLALAAALLAGSPAFLSAAEPAGEDAAFATKLITALEKSDYDSFVADGETPFKQLKKEQFDGVAAKIAPRLQAGHELTYLGDLKQRGYHVTLWRVSFKDGSDDILATLSTRDGKVGGFFIH